MLNSIAPATSSAFQAFWAFMRHDPCQKFCMQDESLKHLPPAQIEHMVRECKHMCRQLRDIP